MTTKRVVSRARSLVELRPRKLRHMFGKREAILNVILHFYKLQGFTVA